MRLFSKVLTPIFILFIVLMLGSVMIAQDEDNQEYRTQELKFANSAISIPEDWWSITEGIRGGQYVTVAPTYEILMGQLNGRFRTGEPLVLEFVVFDDGFLEMSFDEVFGLLLQDRLRSDGAEVSEIETTQINGVEVTSVYVDNPSVLLDQHQFGYDAGGCYIIAFIKTLAEDTYQSWLEKAYESATSGRCLDVTQSTYHFSIDQMGIEFEYPDIVSIINQDAQSGGIASFYGVDSGVLFTTASFPQEAIEADFTAEEASQTVAENYRYRRVSERNLETVEINEMEVTIDRGWQGDSPVTNYVADIPDHGFFVFTVTGSDAIHDYEEELTQMAGSARLSRLITALQEPQTIELNVELPRTISGTGYSFSIPDDDLWQVNGVDADASGTAELFGTVLSFQQTLTSIGAFNVNLLNYGEPDEDGDYPGSLAIIGLGLPAAMFAEGATQPITMLQDMFELMLNETYNTNFVRDLVVNGRPMKLLVDDFIIALSTELEDGSPVFLMASGVPRSHVLAIAASVETGLVDE